MASLMVVVVPLLLFIATFSIAGPGVARKVERNELEKRQNCDTKGSFFGLEYALSGYNILFGYPKQSGRDPGWRSTIFKAVYEPKRYTSDCSYLLPAGVNMQRTVACSTSFSSKEVKTRKDFEKSLSANAQVSGGGWGVSFSASVSYNQAVQEMKDTHSVYVFSEARCLYYSAHLDPTVPPALSDNFLVHIRDLQTTNTQEKYFDLFDNYGTHFMKAVDYGARYTKQHKMSKDAYKKASQNSMSIEVTASYEGLFSVSGGFGFSSEQKQAIEGFRQEVTTTTSTLGALPVASGNQDEWASKVKETPAPVIYELTSIEELFTAKYFQNVANIDYSAIKTKVNKYKQIYCQQLMSRGQVTSCDALQDIECPIPSLNGKGSLNCKKPSGTSTTSVLDGDVCTVTCNSDYMPTYATVTCQVFGEVGAFDNNPVCVTKYPVYHVASPYGTYKLTKAQAEQMCRQNGHTLASYSQLQDALNKGLSHCRCGWLSDGRSAYPMTYDRSGCGSKGINICGWTDRWNGWCAY